MGPETLAVPSERLEAFHQGVERVAGGQWEDEAFKPARLVVGGHRQRGGSGYMLRVRVPGGRLSLEYWLAVARVAEGRCRSRRVHLTLRQDLQLYDLDLAGLDTAVEDLRAAGLSTYASGGSTVRNITCSVLADLEPGLPFDPYPQAVALSARLSRTPYFHGLPRKFKIGFAGPGPEEAQAWLNDLGFVARVEAGKRGFRVLAGGGLGGSPQSAFELAEFLPEEELGPLTEAVLDYFREVSPADKPNTNRFKYILRAQGVEAVRAEVLKRKASRPLDEARPSLSAARSGTCLWVEPLLGDLSPTQMRGLGSALKRVGVEFVRISFDQRLLVPGLTVLEAENLLRAAEGLGLPASLERRGARTVVCTGPGTCNRGLVNSRELAKALLREGLDLPVELHISGCQNGCSQHLIAPLSLQGTAQAGAEGRVPSYFLRAGFPAGPEGLRFSQPLATLPARRVPKALRRLLSAWRSAGEPSGFERWLHEQGRAGVAKVLAGLPAAPEEGKDWGSDKPFEVVLGGSECH